MLIPILFGVGVALMFLVAFLVIKAMDHPPVRKMTPAEESRFEIVPVVTGKEQP